MVPAQHFAEQAVSEPQSTSPAPEKSVHVFGNWPCSGPVEGAGSAAELLLHPQKGQKVWFL